MVTILWMMTVLGMVTIIGMVAILGTIWRILNEHEQNKMNKNHHMTTILMVTIPMMVTVPCDGHHPL